MKEPIAVITGMLVFVWLMAIAVHRIDVNSWYWFAAALSSILLSTLAGVFAYMGMMVLLRRKP